MALSRRKFIQTGVGSAVAAAATAAGAEVLNSAVAKTSTSDTHETLNEAPQAANLPPQSTPGGQGQAYTSPVTWAGPVNVTLAPDRMPEIPADKLTEAQKKATEDFGGQRHTPVSGPFIALLRSPDLMLHARDMGEFLHSKSVLAPKVSEFAILITARFWSNQYEWALHYPFAIKAGVNPDLLAALADGRQVKGVYESDQLVFEFCSELLRSKSLSDTTYHWAVTKIGEQAVVELATLVGYYSMLSLLGNMARTPLPEGAKPQLPQLPR